MKDNITLPSIQKGTILCRLMEGNATDTIKYT